MTDFNNNDLFFISTYIGPLSLLDISNNFKKIENAHYFFFTNIEKNLIKNNSWNIITIDKNFLELLKNNLNNNSVKISRYFKFNVYSYFSKYLNININNKFVFYCDSYLYPKYNINWIGICSKLSKNDLPIIQYNHKRNFGGIKLDLECIVKGNKEILKNIKKTEEYLNNINSKVNISTPQYFENTVIGFYSNEKVIQLCDQFWKFYIQCPTYRDQPLWNFIYLHNNKKPFIDNNFRSYFDGIKKIERKVKEYKDANL